MDELWGEVRPVPEQALIVLHGGEQIEEAGRRLEAEYTPGHASHHVSYFAADAGIAFVGDTAGVKVLPNGLVLPPTPPPDIDVPAWHQSLERIERWQPETLFLTHFGPSAPTREHLSALRENLELATRFVRESFDHEKSDEAREIWFVERCRRLLRQRLNESDARTYEIAGRFDLNWRGLARHLRKSGAVT
jgi:glyoxylase-like metal-dependent hydrolase (beta-lactamase superfamily II)